MKHLTKTFAAGLTAATLLGAPAVAEELSFASFTPPQHTVTAAIVQPLTEALAASNTGLSLRFYPGGELCPGPVEQYVRVVQGVADIAWGLPGYNSQQFPLSMLVELPGVVDAAGSGYEAISRVYDEYLRAEFVGTRALAVWTSEPSVIIMRDRDVRTPADLAGLRIRVSGAIAGQLIEALGATPVQMPANEMYNAIQTGLIDGIMTGSSAIGDFRINEVAQSYTTGIALGNILFYTVMNEARYQSLSPEQQAAVDAASGYGLSQSGEQGWNANATATLAELRANPRPPGDRGTATPACTTSPMPPISARISCAPPTCSLRPGSISKPGRTSMPFRARSFSMSGSPRATGWNWPTPARA